MVTLFFMALVSIIFDLLSENMFLNKFYKIHKKKKIIKKIILNELFLNNYFKAIR